MTAEQTVTFIKLLNHHEILSFSGEDSVMLDLGAGAEVRIRTDGSQSWYLNGQLHRNNDPAEIWADGTQRWWLNGQLHRTDGPAEIWADGTQHWFLNGEEVTQKDHAHRMGQ